MDRELTTKVIIFILIGILFFVRSGFTRHNKKFHPKTLIKYIISLAIFVLYFGNFIDFALLPINIYFRFVAGGVLILIGFALFFQAHKHLGKNWDHTIEDKFSKDKKFVRTGPYRYIRHPIYSASLVSLLGFGVLSANWLLFGIPFLILILFYSRKIPQEEKSLIKNFGKPYMEYMKETGSLIPKM